MRNLKKFLALVMAMVMAFSLMLSASAAEIKPSTNFSDNDGITEAFVEAVDVLAGMKVYKGDDTGTLRPGSTITRAEVAALIYRLATGDVDDVREGLYANYGNFKDVSEGDWFAGYVGYCANAGFIKDHGGYFNPYAPVTGYEALAMILRVIGYDKNHEFEGATWQTNVSALGTSLGILDNVKTTDYARTLHLASRRDVVASLLFRAVAYVPMVEYTPIAGYNKYQELVGNNLRPTVGEWQFGLTYGHGIITGNQETGEANTKWTTSTPDSGALAQNSAARYVNRTTAGSKATTVSLKMDTGLTEFGHKFKVWYNRDDGGAKTVYTAYDKVEKVQLAQAGKVNGTPSTAEDGSETSLGTTPADSGLGNVARRYGFSVGTADTTYWSPSFRSFWGNKIGQTGAFWNDQGLYLLISNTTGNSLDAVVSVNVEATKITRVDNISATQTITVPTNASDDFIDQTDNGADVDLSTSGTNSDTLLGENSNGTWGSTTVESAKSEHAWIKQSALTANSVKDLNSVVMATAIGVDSGTSSLANKSDTGKDGLAANIRRAGEIKNYHTMAVETKVGQVVNFKTTKNDDAGYTITQRNFDPDYVTLADGTKIEKSLLWYTVPGNGSANTAIPQ